MLNRSIVKGAAISMLLVYFFYGKWMDTIEQQPHEDFLHNVGLWICDLLQR